MAVVVKAETDGEAQVLVSRAGEPPRGGDDIEDEEDATEGIPGPSTGIVDIDGRVILHARPARE
jgi:hypothetical protein